MSRKPRAIQNQQHRQDFIDDMSHLLFTDPRETGRVVIQSLNNLSTEDKLKYTGAALTGVAGLRSIRTLAMSPDLRPVKTVFVPAPRGVTLYSTPIPGTDGVRVTTVTAAMRARFKDNGYLHPVTNKLTQLSFWERIEVDHILPTRHIIHLDGFNTLTKVQMENILQDKIELGNLQPLTKSLNSSKGSKIGKKWEKHRGEEISNKYKNNIARRQAAIEAEIIETIKSYNLYNTGAKK